MRAILSAVGVLALAASASAATLKVPQQYGTIQEAVNAAADGDTIVVSRGVYYESVSVGTPNLRILGKKAILDGTFEGGPALSVAAAYYDGIDVYAPGVTVQGFTFRNGYNHVGIYAPGCSVLKCVSRNAANNGIYVGGYDGAEISGNRITGAGNCGIYASGSSATLAKNAIRQAGYSGIQAFGTGISVDGNTISNVAYNYGIYLSGSAAVVTNNRVSNTGGDGIYLSASDSTVTGNRVSWASNNNGIYVSGDRCLVQKNSVTVAYYLLQAYGVGSSILDNRVSGGLGGIGIEVGGDDLTVTGNLAQQIAENGSGFYIYNYGTSGGTVVSGNTAEDASGMGFYFSLYNSTVSDCRANRCGAMGYRAGFEIYGSGTTYEDCAATDSHGDGFYVNATGNTFVTCSAVDSTINGFRVYGGGNTFTSCLARGTGGQGFQNQGTNTVLSGGVFVDNRIDISNSVLNSATFLGGLGSVVFDTGDELTEPEVFYYGVW